MFQCNDKHSFRLPVYFSNRLHSGKVGLCIPGSLPFIFPPRLGFILFTQTLVEKKKLAVLF